jgi:2-succinyl-6-hydroxy-2,4-cyclohexadiene-1-carboxylate synthase
VNRLAVAPGFYLNVERAGSGPPIVFLHGFTGSAASWAPFTQAFCSEFSTFAVDIVGHGLSDKPPALEHYQMRRAAADVVRAVGMLGVRRAAWIGYSMGGRVALTIAATHPGSVGPLVLIGASAGLAGEAERQARRNSDEAIAQHIEADGVAKFVDYWEKLPLFATQQQLPEETRAAIRAGRLRNDPVGLVNSLRGMGAGSQEPLHERLAAIACPTLFLAGEHDAKYTEIGRELVAAMPAARFLEVPGAGHAAHVENSEFCLREIRAFLDETR